MSRAFLLGVSVSLFIAVLLVLTLAGQAWVSHRASRRAQAVHRLGLDEERLKASFDQAVQGDRTSWLRQRLDQAGDARSPGQLLFGMALLSAFGLFGTVLFLDGPAQALGLALGALPLLLLRRKAALRSLMITEQLPDAFDRIGRTLRAGHAFSDALRIAGEESPAPLADELARVATLHSLGVDLRRCLDTLASRNPANFEIRLFVGGVLLNRETGGNLVEILDHLAETVRERLIFDGKVLALTAEVRLSAWILGSLPFVATAVLLLIKPGYLSPLTGSDPGRALLFIGTISLLLGVVVMRRLAAVEA